MTVQGHKIIFKAVVGSHAYGTNVEGSDIDIKGVYIQDPMEILTYGYKEQIEVNKDEVYYEVRRFLELLESANPTVLELLFMPDDCIQYVAPEFQLIVDNRYKFLTKKCKNSFGGYAVQQIKKAKGLNKKMNWEKGDMVRKTPLDFCYVYRINGEKTEDGDDFANPSNAEPLTTVLKRYDVDQADCGLSNLDHVRDGYILYHPANSDHVYHGLVGDDSNALRLSSIPKKVKPWFYLHYNKDAYTQHCNAFKEYSTWLRERNEQRYVDLKGHGQKIDGKNMLHCQRLIDTACDIATAGQLIVRRPNAEYLKSIRKGTVDLQVLLNNAENAIVDMDTAFEQSTLPEDAPRELKQELLTKIREYRKPYKDYHWLNRLMMTISGNYRLYERSNKYQK